jgi:hypothetical protein
MQRHGIRALLPAAAATAALAAPLTGCSNDNTPSNVTSQAASAVSKAGDALASATAEAGRKFKEFKNGVDAKSDVRLDNRVSTDSAGHATAELTVTNSTSSAKTYVIQVDFRDKSGNLLDTVVVTVDDVAAGAAKDATARSGRTLSGDVTADVARAARH